MKEISSLGSLLEWLISSKQRSLIEKASIDQIALLCKRIDESGIAIEQKIGLEIHHRNQTRTDISLFGGIEVLNIPGIDYPGFAKEWEKFTRIHGNGQESNLIAEFDDTNNGYQIMGFFQPFSKGRNRSIANTECALASIAYYIDTRCQDLEFGTRTRSMELTMPLVSEVFEQLGEPSYIGYLAREGCVVKLILRVSIKNLSEVVQFCSFYYRNIIIAQLSSLESFTSMLRHLVLHNRLVRLSVDINLLGNKLLDRLAFECMPFQAKFRHSRQSNQSITPEGQELFIESKFAGYTQSTRLEDSLPYAEKRPSNSLIDEERLLVCYAHRKLSISSYSCEVKDYVMVSVKKDKNKRA